MSELARPYLGTDGALRHCGVVKMAIPIGQDFLDCKTYVRGPAIPSKVDVSLRWLETAVVAGNRVSVSRLAESIAARRKKCDYTIV